MSVAAPLHPEQVNTAIKTPDHLIKWLHATNKPWLVFRMEDVVRGQSWPEGVQALILLIQGYKDYRSTVGTGQKEAIPHPTRGKIHVDRMKGEDLELQELDQCIRWLIAKAVDRDPNWSLEQPAL